MTAQLSRERLEEKLLEHIKHGGDSEEETMIRMLLAGMCSEPVGVFNIGSETCPDHLVAWTAKGQNLPNGVYWLHTAPPAPVADDYFASLVTQARARADKAMRKFPQPNYVLNKVAEESGEVIKAVIHYTEGREEWRNVEGEIIDNLAMLIRLVQEGDQVIGFTPPTDCLGAMLKQTCTCPSGDGSLRWPCPDHPPETLGTSTVPDGWKLVPVEPTAEMCKAGYEAQDKWPSEQCDNFKERHYSFSQPRYKAMLAEAPTAPEQEV
jgi:NTP pyrophosphatase (non-canonical NTP hydrolase)